MIVHKKFSIIFIKQKNQSKYHFKMKRKVRISLCFLIAVIFLNLASVSGQILKDTVSLNLIKSGINFVYNQQFDEAQEVYTKISTTYPGHPVVSLFKALMMFWKDYPIVASSPSRVDFEKELRDCIALCEKEHSSDVEAENLLANLCARGMLMLFYASNDLVFDVLPIASTTYPLIRRSFDYTTVFPDFYYFTGLYNYYREAYPETYPVYKPIAFLFPGGDRQKGIADLVTCAKTSIELKAEAYVVLSWICIGYENDYQQALFYSKSLHELYPANREYRAEFIKNLLLSKLYDEAEEHIESFRNDTANAYFTAEMDILQGILAEKKYHDYSKAMDFYTKGSRNISQFGSFGNDYASYAYFGMSRISGINGDKNFKKTYYDKAMDLASFKKVNFND